MYSPLSRHLDHWSSERAPRQPAARSGNAHFVDNRPQMQSQARMIQRMHGHEPGQPSSNKRGVTQLLKVGTLYKNSDRGWYRTKKANDNYVGVNRPDAANPQPDTWITSTGGVTSGFHAYEFDAPYFVNDCLQFAKRLGYMISGLPPQDHHRLKAVIGNIPGTVNFAIKENGGSSANKLADGDHGLFAQNSHANPIIGQSYTTVPKTRGMHLTDGCRFHVATVVAKDGSDTVTCEADAGDHGRTEPVFDMYSTDPTSTLTFHTTYADSYGGKRYAVTGILQPG
ncbi:hypothetical protein [Herbaspirillum seropedicae]|uniref:hypothetical protein n=1 Tax=Herbaspirillum seropedicae TaxID=964 RepID=UPI0031D3F789